MGIHVTCIPTAYSAHSDIAKLQREWSVANAGMPKLCQFLLQHETNLRVTHILGLKLMYT